MLILFYLLLIILWCLFINIKFLNFIIIIILILTPFVFLFFCFCNNLNFFIYNCILRLSFSQRFMKIFHLFKHTLTILFITFYIICNLFSNWIELHFIYF